MYISFCKFLQGFTLFIFSFHVFCFCFFVLFLKFFYYLFDFGTLWEQNPYFLALCKKTNPDFFWRFATFLAFCKNLSQFLNLQEHELLLQRNEELGLCLFFFISLLTLYVFLIFFNFYFILFISDFFDTLRLSWHFFWILQEFTRFLQRFARIPTLLRNVFFIFSLFWII